MEYRAAFKLEDAVAIGRITVEVRYSRHVGLFDNCEAWARGELTVDDDVGIGRLVLVLSDAVGITGPAWIMDCRFTTDDVLESDPVSTIGVLEATDPSGAPLPVFPRVHAAFWSEYIL